MSTDLDNSQTLTYEIIVEAPTDGWIGAHIYQNGYFGEVTVWDGNCDRRTPYVSQSAWDRSFRSTANITSGKAVGRCWIEGKRKIADPCPPENPN